MSFLGKPGKDKHLFGMVTVGEKGQIVIPKKARDIYGIKPGDSLFACGDKNGIALISDDRIMKLMSEIFGSDDYMEEDE